LRLLISVNVVLKMKKLETVVKKDYLSHYLGKGDSIPR